MTLTLYQIGVIYYYYLLNSNVLGPDSQKVSSLKSEVLVSNLRFFLDFSQI